MNNLVIGRGKLLFDMFAAGTETKTGERYLGNTPAFNLSVETQEQDHYNSDEGFREKDESVTIQTDYSGALTTDNINPANVAMFFFGETSTVARASATNQTDTFENVLQGLYYQLGTSPANPAGLTAVTVTAVTGPSSTPTYAEGTDYTVDALGSVQIVEGGAITSGSTIEVVYDVAAHSEEVVISGNNQAKGALRFRAFNAAGKQTDYYMPKVTLKPNGEFALKGDDWQQISFNIEILKLTGHEAIYANGRPYTP